jgi:glyceraldehyde 3-phosphate dehydrogenase
MYYRNRRWKCCCKSLEGKLTSNAIRVPVPNGSLVVLNLEVSKTTSVQEINAIMKNTL